MTDRLEAFVEHLPQLARESTNVESTTECDLEALADRAWRVIDTGSVSLEVSDTGSVRGDPGRLQQALENLFRNAIKHSATDPHAQPAETARRGPTDRQSTVAEVETGAVTTVRIGTTPDGFYVEDDGPGIPSSVRENLFEYGTSTDGGSGFGLAIVRTIVEAHGWEIEALESDTDGARFEITTASA